jgi:hypothetical protein
MADRRLKLRIEVGAIGTAPGDMMRVFGGLAADGAKLIQPTTSR